MKPSKLPSLSYSATSIDIAATKKISLIAQKYVGVISLGQGIPSFETANHIKKAALDAIAKDLTGKYTTGYGIIELREALVQKLKKENGISTSADEIIITHGGIEAIYAVLTTILNPQDDIIVLTPDYASHTTQLKIVLDGKDPIQVPLTETLDGWKLDPDRLEKAVTKNTKAILVCNPCNPTGKVYSREELEAIAKIAQKYNLFIISDEMYEYFIYNGKKHISIGSFPQVKNQVISVFGLSKTYAMTGWRIGYITAIKPLIDQIFKIHDSLVTCATAVSQYAALAAIKGPQTNIQEYKAAFLKRREIVLQGLGKTDKVLVIKPEGAYYMFVKFKKKVDDQKFILDALKHARVAVVPGSAFGKGGESHIRISFGAEEAVLKAGVKRLVDYINKTI